MSEISFTALTAVVGFLATISGIILGWLGKARTIKHDAAQEAREGAIIRADVEYIKRGIDEVRVEQKLQGQRFDALSERVTRVEESAKQAHKRIDKLEGGMK